jgi:hypothetical protein
VHPHLGEHCKANGLDQIAVDLLQDRFDPPVAEPKRAIVLSVAALRQKFVELLSSEGIESADIVRAVVVFFFRRSDRWPAGCHIEVEKQGGVVVRDTLDFSGRRAELLRTSTQ